ncbi:MAG: riboflavin synthase [Chitinivibrionia bacterium]|nr:riboflavin synthase [Chitinivibrionia bacterium]
MFTGLVETIGEIKSFSPENKSAVIGVSPKISDFACKIGDSVAINGVCLTVEKISGRTLFFRAVSETLSKTNLGDLKISQTVNLERALPANGRFDGHIVLGHIDTAGKIESVECDGDSRLFWLSADERYSKYIAKKGSVAVDGISLTVADVANNKFLLSIIPHTFKNTTLATKKAGDSVNLECDVFARYIERMLNVNQSVRAGLKPAPTSADRNLEGLLERSGF